MSRNYRPHIGATLCAFGLVNVMSAAQAADSAPSRDALEEVVVSAQRQEENLQKTPIAVTSVTSEVFDKLGNGNVANLQMVAPNLQVSGGGAGVLIGIRGIITSNGTDVGDPAVAFETDGLYHSRSGTQGAQLFDVDHIEVLRGPQGTLYGRNATTGVVNVISKKPTQEFNASGYVEAGNYNSRNAFGAINVPLSDSIAIRAAAITANHDPFYTNGFGDDDYGDQHVNAARLSGLFKPNDDISLLLRGSFDRSYGNGPPQNVNIPLSADPFTFRANARGNVDAKQYTGQAVFDWKLPVGTLTYDGGYHKSDSNAFIASGFPNIRADTGSSTWQHELRLANSVDNFKFVGGLFYFEENQHWFIYVDPFARFLMPDEGQKSKAAFGQATYSFTDTMRVTAGLRYTQDDKHRTGANYQFRIVPPNTVATPVVSLSNFADISSSKLNYKLGVDFDVTPTSMLYGSVATGYKQGGFFDGDQRTGDNTYDPENVLSFEVGYKSRFLDNRLQLNVAAFQYKYTDFQVSFQDAVLITRTYNAQEARNTGLELEVEAAVSAHDRVSLSGTYLHARYEEFNIPGGADAFGRSSYSGNRLPFAPDYSASVTWDHTWDVGNNHAINFGVVSHWQSEVDLEFHGFRNTRQDAYSKTNVNLSWGEATGRYTVTAFGRNLEDDEVLVGAALPNGATNPAAAATGSLGQPRTYGVRVDVNF